MNESDLEDRQAAAAVIFGLIGCVVLPVCSVLGLLFVSAWGDTLGVKNVHATFWGWLSKTTVNKAGHHVYNYGDAVWHYYLLIFTLYLLYQVCEILWGLFKVFKKALA